MHNKLKCCIQMTYVLAISTPSVVLSSTLVAYYYNLLFFNELCKQHNLTNNEHVG